MARLTEPEAGTESIDSLRRRFQRQNRDLIRANATQAIKIRALETQISNLLTENLAIRDTAIHLQTQLDQSRSRHVAEDIEAIQRRLEEKLRECTDIVAGLSSTNKIARRSSLQTVKQSPPPREWRTRATLSEVLEQQPGFLPTIVEGKLYPRRTLEPSEIRTIIEDASTNSPEAGPPPTLHPDNIITQSTLITTQDAEYRTAEASEDTGVSSVNFESRKRRRQTYVRPDEDEQPVATSENPLLRSPERLQGKPVRANRRRRMSGSQEFDGDRVETQDFTFKRKDAVEVKVENEDEARSAQIKDNIMDNKPDLQVQPRYRLSMSPQRPALGAKTTNLSPMKAVRSMTGKAEKEPSLKAEKARSTRDSKTVTEDYVVTEPQMTHEPEVVDIDLDNIKLEPKTPAFHSLVSPTSTQPSEARRESRDTPPPTIDFSQSHSTADNSTATTRPSRRARSAVNYAEPNLITKMRRPTKDLADAVVVDRKHSTEPEVATEDQQPRRIVIIKKEQEWKPASSSFMPGTHQPDPASPSRSRQIVEEPKTSQLMDGGNKDVKVLEDVPTTVNTSISDQGLTSAMEALDIFEFKSSSPAETNLDTLSTTKLAPARRRQSLATLPSSSNANKPLLPAANGTRPSTLTPKDAVRSASGALQRATSTLGTERAARLANVERGPTARSRRRSMQT